ncbi:MAG: DUF6702 family protein [Flavobacteriales bacterium]
MFLNKRFKRRHPVFLLSLLIAAVSCAASVIVHKFYISKTIIEFNNRSQQFEITCKLFTDDLELALSQLQGKSVKLEVGDGNDALVEAYCKQHLKCAIDGVPMEWRWVGKEVENDLTFCYFELYHKPDFTAFTVTNDLLVAQFPDQQNIVDLSIMGSTQTMVFVHDRIQQTFHR